MYRLNKMKMKNDIVKYLKQYNELYGEELFIFDPSCHENGGECTVKRSMELGITNSESGYRPRWSHRRTIK